MSRIVDDYRITACFGFIKKFALKYQALTEKNPRELEAMHAAGLLSSPREETPEGTTAQKPPITAAQNKRSLDYIVPTGNSYL